MANTILFTVEHPTGSNAARTARAALRSLLEAAALDEVELSVSLVDDRRIRALNRRWRSKDQATDVLSFPAAEQPLAPGQRTPLGDLVLSLDTARRVAKEQGRRLGDELALYLAHGLLHLLGHDHKKKSEALEMADAERRLLGGAGMLERASS